MVLLPKVLLSHNRSNVQNVRDILMNIEYWMHNMRNKYSEIYRNYNSIRYVLFILFITPTQIYHIVLSVVIIMGKSIISRRPTGKENLKLFNILFLLVHFTWNFLSWLVTQGFIFVMHNYYFRVTLFWFHLHDDQYK